MGRSLEEVVAREFFLRAHPKADTLWLCDVEAGAASHRWCAESPQPAGGDDDPYGSAGTETAGGARVKEAEFRVRLVGMLLAEDEMGLTEDHTGVMVLPESCRPAISVVQGLTLEDWALEIGITPNRPDCARDRIAREIAAPQPKGKLRKPQIRFKESGPEDRSADQRDP